MRLVIGALFVAVVVLFVASMLLIRAAGNPSVMAQVNVSPVAAPSRFVGQVSEPLRYPQCPRYLQTPEQMATTIGGDPGDWTVPEGWWGAWTLRSAEMEDLVWPGFGFFDTANAGMRLQHDVDSAEASFHCEEPPTT